MALMIPAKFNPVLHLRHPGYNSKDEPDPVDYTPMAQASAAASAEGIALGREQLAESKRQYEINRAAMQPIADAQLDIMNQSKAQGDDYYEYNKSTYRPLEQGIVADAVSFDTEGKREELARDAVLDTTRAQANAEAQSNRSMASMGVNPNSGRFAGMRKGLGLQNAAMRAGAATGARTRAEGLGYARKMDAAGLGRGLSGASSGAYQVATGAGNSAGANTMAPGTALLSGMSAGNGTVMAGHQMGLSGMGNVLSGQQGAYNATQASNGAAAAGLGTLVGTIGGAFIGGPAGAAVGSRLSDRRVKFNIEHAGKDEATGLTLYAFNYIWDAATRYVGVMADEVRSKFPDAVTTGEDGIDRVNYPMLGLEMVEV
jgi:hypothetical protein